MRSTEVYVTAVFESVCTADSGAGSRSIGQAHRQSAWADAVRLVQRTLKCSTHAVEFVKQPAVRDLASRSDNVTEQHLDPKRIEPYPVVAAHGPCSHAKFAPAPRTGSRTPITGAARARSVQWLAICCPDRSPDTPPPQAAGRLSLGELNTATARQRQAWLPGVH